MSPRILHSWITAASLAFLVLISGVPALAEDESEVPAVTYLDNAVRAEGDLALVFKLDSGGEDSPFFGRYHDPFEGNSFYLGEFRYRGWESDGSFLRFNLNDSWDPSYRVAAGLWKPGEMSATASDNRYRYFEIPSANPATRRDFTLDIEGYGCSDSYALNYSYRENVIRNPATELFASNWETNEARLSYDFELGDWNGSTQFSQKSFNDRRGSINDVDHTTGVVRAGRNFGDLNYVEGNMAYGVADVDDGSSLRTFRIGGYGRFVNALGVDRLNVTSHVNWANRNTGPSRMHPAGDEFDFDLDGKWRAASNLWLHGSWDFGRSDVFHADQYTNFGFYVDPDRHEIHNGRILQDTVETNKWNLGGRWRIDDDLDFTVDLNRLDRDGLPLTDFVRIASPTLWWKSENRYTYALRYNPRSDIGIENGDWLLKYEILDRSNIDRNTQSSVERLSINWTGMIDPDFMLYIGGGFLKTENSLSENEIDQNGREYGGGWSWSANQNWSLFGDYWAYDVGGDWGYDQTSFSAGLGFEPDEYWKWTLEYGSVTGDFIDRTDLDYDVDDLLLNLSYKW